MKDARGVKVYTRHQTGRVDREYYDLRQDPHQLHNQLGPEDDNQRNDPPDSETLAYYEERLDALYRCAGQSCRTAENAPLLPGGTTP
jgi:hypothetical protein